MEQTSMTEKASLKRRGNAGALDILLTVFVVGWVAMGLTRVITGNLLSPALIGIDGALLTAYWLLDATRGGTFGKRVFHLRIARSNGSAASAARLLGRALLKGLPLIGGPTLGMAMIVATQQRVATGEIPVAFLAASTLSGFCYVLAFVDSILAISARRQAVHDLIADTSVFAVPRAQTSPQA